jgi:hypothetical protein
VPDKASRLTPLQRARFIRQITLISLFFCPNLSGAETAALFHCSPAYSKATFVEL